MSSNVPIESDRVLLGHITGTSGLKGWVKVHSDTDPRENIFGFKSWWLENSGTWTQVDVLQGRPQGKTIVVHIKGFDTPETASVLIGAKIAVSRLDLPKPAAGEYYWRDLIGMQVVTLDGVDIGPIDRLFETGANDVAVVKDCRVKPETDSGGSADESMGKEGQGKEVLVPWLVPDVITDVNFGERQITVDWDPDF